MGFFSAIGDFIDGAVRCVGNFVKGAISAVGKSVGVIAKGVMEKIAKIAASKVLGPVLGPVVAKIVVECIVEVISKLAKELGITKREENLEKLGYRMEEMERHEDWKHRGDFDSFQKYCDYMKEKVPEVDQKKLAENKHAYRDIGVATLSYEIGQKMGVVLTADFLTDIGRCKMSVEEVKAVIEKCKEHGFTSSDVSRYLSGSLRFAESKKVKEAVVAALKDINPGQEMEMIEDRLNDMQAATRSDASMKRLYTKEIQEAQTAEGRNL